MSQTQLIYLALLLVVPSVVEALLLRAAVATWNRLSRRRFPINELRFGFGFFLMLGANIVAALGIAIVPDSIMTLWKYPVALLIKPVIVCVVLKDQFRLSFARAAEIAALQFVYFVLLTLLIVFLYLRLP